METTNGLPLSLVGGNIWKGQNKTNGQLMLIHNYYLEVGYSELAISAALAAELAALRKKTVPFGNGLFYDRYEKATKPHKVYAGSPVGTSAIPKLAGVIGFDAGLQSLQPAVGSDGVLPYNKGKIVKRGFLRYKFGKNKPGTLGAAGCTMIGYSDIDDETMCFFIELDTGDPIFAAPTGFGGITLPDLTGDTTVANLITHLSEVEVPASSLVPTLAGAVYAGKIVHLLPEDESVVVELGF